MFVRNLPLVKLLLAWRNGHFNLIVSDHILAELARTLDEPYFSKRLTPTQRTNNIALVRDEAVYISISVTIHGVATHPEDDLVLATAVSGPVQYLVTGDSKLQKLGTYKGITIVSPREFLDVIQTQPAQNQ